MSKDQIVEQKRRAGEAEPADPLRDAARMLRKAAKLVDDAREAARVAPKAARLLAEARANLHAAEARLNGVD